MPDARDDGGDRRARGQAGGAASGAEDEGLGEELGGDMPARRSSTAITMTLAIPMPPTSSATAPRPRNSVVDAAATASRAVSAAEGWLTATSSRCSGFAVGPSRLATCSVWLTSVRT